MKGFTTEHAVLLLAGLIGYLGMFIYLTFLALGPFGWLDLGFKENLARVVFFDFLLSLIFFLQHSGMVRRSFKTYLLERWKIPKHYHCALYCASSGATLIMIIPLWQQSSSDVLFSARGILRIMARTTFVAGIAGNLWCMKNLGSADILGLSPLWIHIRDEEKEKLSLSSGSSCPLTIRGAYALVRHPMYTFFIIMIWSFPDLTLDRLLFNALWTCWIVGGTYMEERDLVVYFGEDYRKYQRSVPMLMPSRQCSTAKKED